MTMGAATDISVLMGSLAEFHLAEVLQVLSIGRQYVRIELFAANREPAGVVLIKSSKVIQAEAAGLRGPEAFYRLFNEPLRSFHVFRVDTPALIPEPIGSLGDLLVQATTRASTPAAPVAAPPVEPVRVRGLSTPPARRASAAPPPPLPRAPEASGSRPPPVSREMPKLDSGVYRSTIDPRAGRGGPVVLAVASPKGGVGKTTLSLNLALSLARRDYQVALVDGDINGDVLSSVAARAEAKLGVFDVLAEKCSLEEAMRKTIVPNLTLVPAVGAQLPPPRSPLIDYAVRWRDVLGQLSRKVPIVVVDTPAGMFGMTHDILGGCSHVLGVLQAEVLAQRSFGRFVEGLEVLPPAQRPKVVGVVLNMLQTVHGASVGVLKDACDRLPAQWLFDTAIPRSNAFLEAAEMGLPLRLVNENNPPAVTFLFDVIASELLARLDLMKAEVRPAARSFLA
jgi:chromosome partitioning protein